MRWSTGASLSGVWTVRARLMVYGVIWVFPICGIYWVSFQFFFANLVSEIMSRLTWFVLQAASRFYGSIQLMSHFVSLPIRYSDLLS